MVIAISGDSRFLKPDMTANVSIRTAQHKAILVPDAALRGVGDSRYVYVAGPGGLARRNVTLGARDAQMTEIRKGLAPGERVLVSPAPAMQDGGTQ